MKKLLDFLARLSSRLCVHSVRDAEVYKAQTISARAENGDDRVTYHLRCRKCGQLFAHHHYENPDDRMTAAVIREFDASPTHTIH